jgi:hypothetical protein
LSVPEIVSSLTKHISGYKAEREKVQKMLDEVNATIEGLRQEESSLKHGIVPKQEFIEMVQDQIGRFAEKGRERQEFMLHAHIQGFSRQHPVNVAFDATSFKWSKIQAAKSGEEKIRTSATIPTFLSCGNPHKYDESGSFDLEGLCAMFEDVMKAQIAKNIESMDYPYIEGPPHAERVQRLLALDAELASHRAKRDELKDLLEKMKV